MEESLHVKNQNNIIAKKLLGQIKRYLVADGWLLWCCRGLSLFGKVTIIKSFLLLKMLYVFSVIPASQDFKKQLNTIIYNFFWNGPDKIARSAAINDIRFGGVNLIDLVTSILVVLYHGKFTLIICSGLWWNFFV